MREPEARFIVQRRRKRMRPVERQIVTVEVNGLSPFAAGVCRQSALIDGELAANAHAKEHTVRLGEIVINAEVVQLGVVRIGRCSEVVVKRELPSIDVRQRKAADDRSADPVKSTLRDDVVREWITDSIAATS